MSEYNQDQLTQDVIDALRRDARPALQQVMTSLVKHLHAFAREVDLKPEEWIAGHRSSSPRTGQICDRQAARSSSCCRTRWACRCWSSRWRRRAPAARPTGRDAADRGHRAGPVLLGRRARPAAGQRHRRRRARRADALHGPRHRPATASRWPARCSTSGPATATACTTCSWRPSRRCSARGRFRTDAEGRYWFWSIRPTYYPVPDDGPVGDMLRAMGRSTPTGRATST